MEFCLERARAMLQMSDGVGIENTRRATPGGLLVSVRDESRARIEHPCPSLCFGGSAQKIRELGQRRLRAECPLCVSLGTTGPGDRALTRQFLEPLFLVVSTRERRHEGNQVVDISFRESERLDVLIEERIL
jgi:hypothetical protein